MEAGLLPFEAEDGDGLVRPCAYTTGRDALERTFPRPLGAGAALHGRSPITRFPWALLWVKS